MVTVRLSLIERVINVLGGLPQKRGEHFIAFHKRWADLLRPIVGTVEAERDEALSILREWVAAFQDPMGETGKCYLRALKLLEGKT